MTRSSPIYLKSIGFKPLDEDKFAVILKGKICDRSCKDEKSIPELLAKQGISGCFIYLFNKKDKTCFHRKFNRIGKKVDKAQFQKCFDDLKEQARNKIHIDPKENACASF